jgi:hypothetical protein
MCGGRVKSRHEIGFWPWKVDGWECIGRLSLNAAHQVLKAMKSNTEEIAKRLVLQSTIAKSGFADGLVLSEQYQYAEIMTTLFSSDTSVFSEAGQYCRRISPPLFLRDDRFLIRVIPQIGLTDVQYYGKDLLALPTLSDPWALALSCDHLLLVQTFPIILERSRQITQGST